MGCGTSSPQAADPSQPSKTVGEDPRSEPAPPESIAPPAGTRSDQPAIDGQSSGCAYAFVTQKQGAYLLQVGEERLSGSYSLGSSRLYDAASCPIADLSCDPVGQSPFDATFFERNPEKYLPAVAVVNSEITEAIQDERNSGAYFVLPSQFNGVNYPSHDRIVENVRDYIYDQTGGPRALLAVHPALGQFCLDNASNRNRATGINMAEDLLKTLEPKGYGFELDNGYLKMPMPTTDAEADELLEAFRSQLHKLTPMIASDIPACGALPTRKGVCKAKHTVGLVHASSIPINAYMNQAAKGSPAERLHKKCAESALAAQYYGAMAKIAARSSVLSPAVVYLMPVGGGVFNNPIDGIARAISLAVEKLDDDGLLDSLSIHVLAWKGNPREGVVLKDLLGNFSKLRRVGTKDCLMGSAGSESIATARARKA